MRLSKVGAEYLSSEILLLDGTDISFVIVCNFVTK